MYFFDQRRNNGNIDKNNFCAVLQTIRESMGVAADLQEIKYHQLLMTA